MELVVTPLGTVSPYPTDKCNCPGFLVEYNVHKILLDCGNGILKMLNIPNDLKNLDVILTHYHSDHIGDVGVLQYASFTHHNLGNISELVNVYLPRNEFRVSKQNIISNEESYMNYNFIDDGLKIRRDDLEIEFYNNQSHAIESFVIGIYNKDLKLVYTSDIGTRNFDGLVNFCKGADLIICESSYLLEHNYNGGTHFTADDAGRLAKLANAKKLLLTHFWPEIEKEKYLEEAKKMFDNTEVATEGKKLVLK